MMMSLEEIKIVENSWRAESRQRTYLTLGDEMEFQNSNLQLAMQHRHFVVMVVRRNNKWCGNYVLHYGEKPRREISPWINVLFQARRSTKVRLVCMRVMVLVSWESTKATWIPWKWTRMTKNTWMRRSRTRTLYHSMPSSTSGGGKQGKWRSLTTWKINAPQGVTWQLCICWQERPSFAF